MEITIKLYFKIYIFIFCFFINKSNDIITNNHVLSPNLAILNLKYFHNPISDKNNFTSLDYLDNIHSSLLFLEIETGKNIINDNELEEKIKNKIKNLKQLILSIFLVIDDFSFYIDDNYFYNEEKNLICRYSSNLSSSYDIIKNIKPKYRHSIYASDYFKVYSDISLNNYNMVKITFRHSLSLDNNISFSCGKAGLLYNSEKQDNYSDFNFIHQIHSNLKNVDYSFMFKFNQSKFNEEIEEGLLIIGVESFIKSNIDYELYSIYTKSKNLMNRQEWRFNADKLIIGKKYINLDNGDGNFVIKAEFEGIEIPYSIFELLNNLYFDDYYKSNICKYEEIYNYYVIIYCNNKYFTNNDINNFPMFQFSIREIGFNFSFIGEELFYKKKDKYFLKLITRIEMNNKGIKLGRMFLKKYNVIFNSDSKMMTFFRINDNNKKSNLKNQDKGKKNGFLIFLSYAFFCILFLAIGFYLGRKYCIIRRKKYANELEDNNYIYEPDKNLNKSEHKLIDL